MVNRLEPLNLTSFVGGLNLRASTFQLAEDESPDLLNVDIDPRGGFYTRRGWQRWNDEEIIDTEDEVEWKPRNAFAHTLSGGEQRIYVVNDDVIFAAGTDKVFAPLVGPEPAATPHGADFAAWGDDIYIVSGRTQPTYRRIGDAAPSLLASDSDDWSEVDAPLPGVLPKAEYIESHAGYMFVASTEETAVAYNSRIRWSHPDRPDSWRETDFIDIRGGGGKITGITSFQDHLLIFKTNSMWALYGYDEDSWQLVEVPGNVGAPTTTCTTRSEAAVYFFSSANRGGIYAYTGGDPVLLSEKLRPAMEQVFAYDHVFVSWAGQRLWVAVPWTRAGGSAADVSSCFVFDPVVGDGAWVLYNSAYGAVSTVLDGSDSTAKYPLTAMWSPLTAAMVTLDYIDDGYDDILPEDAIGTGAGEMLVTGDGFGFAVTGGIQGQRFDSYYRTRWLHADWPDRKKSWRRPTFVCRQVSQDTDLIVESYRDYDESTVHRSRTLRVLAQGGAFWTEGGYEDADEGGFDWSEGGKADASGRGADWGAQRAGANIIRGGSMGLARAVQLRVRVSPNTDRRKWGVDAVVAKYVMRRFR